jgi:hypothetical protein
MCSMINEVEKGKRNKIGIINQNNTNTRWKKLLIPIAHERYITNGLFLERLTHET